MFFHKTLDTITLFHKASSPASTRVASLLKQINANASSTATIDQASDPTAQMHTRDEPFELDVTEEAPTADQLRTILEYVAPQVVPSVVKGSTNVTEALKAFEKNKETFQRPVVVDWNNGKAVVGGNKSKILEMLKAKQV